MIRLFGLLCIGIFATLLIAGEDHGQKRYGLMLADQQAIEAVVPVAEVAEVRTIFIPAQPVIQPIEVAVRTAVAADTTLAATAPGAAQPFQTLPAPEVPGGTLFTVAARGANVRQGPGTAFAVLDSLIAGEQVLVIAQDPPTDGWSRVRLEGDGVEGFIATKLLRQSE